jgi:hypothetical protein
MDKFNKIYLQIINEARVVTKVYELVTTAAEDDPDYDPSYGFFSTFEKANAEKERIMEEMTADDLVFDEDDFEIIEHEVQ